MSVVLPRLLVEVDVGPDADAEEMERHYGWLQDELLELDLDKVERVTVGPSPPRAKGPGGTAGMLLLTVSNSAAVVALIGVLRSWVGRSASRKVTLRVGDDLLELTRASKDDQTRLVTAFLDRHASS